MFITDMSGISAQDLNNGLKGVNTKVFFHRDGLYGQVDTGHEETHNARPAFPVLPPGQRIPLYEPARKRLGL